MTKKFILLTLCLIFITALVGCGKSNGSAKLKTESEIIADLNQSEDFWYRVAPIGEEAREEFVIKDVIIKFRETEENILDSVFATVTAESSFAVYTGEFIIKYTYTEDIGYTFASIHQNAYGTYDVTAPPTEEMISAQYNRDMFASYPNAKLSGVSIQEIPGRTDRYEVQCEIRYTEDPYCTITEDVAYYCDFINGAWVVTWEPSREPVSVFEYNLPPIPEQDITTAINEFIPDYLGEYSGLNGGEMEDEADPLVHYISGCTLASSNPTAFDLTNISIDLKMYCNQENNYTWECSDIIINGDIFLANAGEYQITTNDVFAGERSIYVSISSAATLDSTGTLILEQVTIIDENPIYFTMEEPVFVESSMWVSQAGNSPTIAYSATNEDRLYYIYLDKNLVPISYAYNL